MDMCIALVDQKIPRNRASIPGNDFRADNISRIKVRLFLYSSGLPNICGAVLNEVGCEVPLNVSLWTEFACASRRSTALMIFDLITDIVGQRFSAPTRV